MKPKTFSIGELFRIGEQDYPHLLCRAGLDSAGRPSMALISLGNCLHWSRAVTVWDAGKITPVEMLKISGGTSVESLGVMTPITIKPAEEAWMIRCFETLSD